MSSTNKTTNYNLSQFVGTDVPSYLGDYNSDMSKIDKAIGDVANSQGSVEQSVVGLTADVQGLSTQVSGVSTSVQQLQTSVAQIDSGYKQADTALSQRITTNANNIQTNTTAIESINTTIGSEDISGIGDGTIKGAISSVNSSLTCRYNPETDKIQVFYNNQWIDSLSAGVQNRYIYATNEPPVSNEWLTLLSGKDANISLANVTSEKILLIAQGTANGSIVYNEKINFSNYSRLRVKYQVYWKDESASGQTGSAAIGISLDANNNFNFIDGCSISPTASTSILESVIDISSLSLSGYIKMSAQHTGSFAIGLNVFELCLEV